MACVLYLLETENDGQHADVKFCLTRDQLSTLSNSF